MLLIFCLLASLQTFATSTKTQKSESTSSDKHNSQDSYVPTCYNCQLEGHIKRNCPTLKCYKCKKLGHFASDCLENNHYFESDTSKLTVEKIDEYCLQHPYAETMKMLDSLPGRNCIDSIGEEKEPKQNKEQKTFVHFQKKNHRDYFTPTQNQRNSLKSTPETWNHSISNSIEPNKECIEANNQSSRLSQSQNYGIQKEKKEGSQNKSHEYDGIQKILNGSKRIFEIPVIKKPKENRKLAYDDFKITRKKTQVSSQEESQKSQEMSNENQFISNPNVLNSKKLSNQSRSQSQRDGIEKQKKEDSQKGKNPSKSSVIVKNPIIDVKRKRTRYKEIEYIDLTDDFEHFGKNNAPNSKKQTATENVEAFKTKIFPARDALTDSKLEDQMRVVVDKVVASLLKDAATLELTNFLAADKSSEEPNYNSSLCTDSDEDCAKPELKNELYKK